MFKLGVHKTMGEIKILIIGRPEWIKTVKKKTGILLNE